MRDIIRSRKFATWRWGNNPSNDEHQSQRCAIIADCYSHSIEVINQLVAAAKADFPNLTDEDIEVVTYGGSYIAGIPGVEFDPGEDHSIVPKSYDRVPHLEVKR